MTEHRTGVGKAPWRAALATVLLAAAFGCSSGGDRAGPPTLPTGIKSVVVSVQYMSGDAPERTITDAAEIAALRDAINRLPRPGNGTRTCATDRGAWALVFDAGKRSATASFDQKGCLELRVLTADRKLEVRQGDEALRAQLTALLS